MGGKGSGRWPRYPAGPVRSQWGWGNLPEMDMTILQAMAEGLERKQIMHTTGLTRRQLDNRLYVLRSRLAAKNDMDMICSGIRKGYLK